MRAHCFTYGSLMCPDIMAAVAGSAHRSVPATLSGYRRSPVLGQAYPGIRPDPDHRVAGVLYFDVSAPAWQRLDAFEGEEYERERVIVTLDEGVALEAWVYVYRPRFAHRLGAGEWDYERFLRTGKARFMAQWLQGSA